MLPPFILCFHSIPDQEHAKVPEVIIPYVQSHKATNYSQQIIVIQLAENGRDALNEIAEAQPDVILMDIRMPVMDGVEMLGIGTIDPLKCINLMSA